MNQESPMPVAISQLILEKFVLGELNSQQMVQIKDLLKGDSELYERYQILLRSNQEIHAKYPNISSSKSFSAVKGLNKKDKMVAFSVALAATLLIVQVSNHPKSEIANLQDRLKGGGNYLDVIKKESSGLTQLSEGDWIKPGDLVQLGFRVDKKTFAAVLSIDDRGHQTVHFPDSGKRAVEVTAGKQWLVSQSFELDDSPIYENFILVTSTNPFDLSQISEWIGKGTYDEKKGHFEISPVAGFQLQTLTLRKKQ